MSPHDIAGLAAAVALGTAGLTWAGQRLGRRLVARNDRILDQRRVAAARTKGSLDDLMEVARAAGVDNRCPMEPVDETAVTGWDPDQRTNTPLVRVGRSLVHPRCAAARRDGRRLCGRCGPLLVDAPRGRRR